MSAYYTCLQGLYNELDINQMYECCKSQGYNDKENFLHCIPLSPASMTRTYHCEENFATFSPIKTTTPFSHKSEQDNMFVSTNSRRHLGKIPTSHTLGIQLLFNYSR